MEHKDKIGKHKLDSLVIPELMYNCIIPDLMTFSNGLPEWKEQN